MKVKSIRDTLRGESPWLGVPTVEIDVELEGKERGASELKTVIEEGVGDIVTVFGKPLKQVDEVSDVIKSVPESKFVIETSGRLEQVSSTRHVLVPIVDRAVVVVKPRLAHVTDKTYMKKYYGWMKEFRLSDVFFKFEWENDVETTFNRINKFFEFLDKSLYHFIVHRRVILMPKDIHDKDECKDVWSACVMYRLRYSARERVRLYK